MIPAPWSFSRLDSFKNCPRSFHEQTVLKRVAQAQGVEAKWGEHVHKVFETFQRNGGGSLPADLQEHMPLMKTIGEWQGTAGLEEKIALNKKLEPCGFFDQEVWYRGIIDFRKNIGGVSRVLDYKTGKPHSKFGQLLTFALHTFIKYPDIHTVIAMYYWTKTQEITRKTYTRSDIPQMWSTLIPDLKQYAEAFKEDVWQPRQSGLCRKHCPVTACEFNGHGRY